MNILTIGKMMNNNIPQTPSCTEEIGTNSLQHVADEKQLTPAHQPNVQPNIQTINADLDVDDMANSHITSEEQNTPTKAKRKLTSAENRELIENVSRALKDGHPPRAIALQLNTSTEKVERILATLATSGKIANCPPSQYHVVTDGVKIKDLGVESLFSAKYIKITPHENGVILTPYIVENEHANFRKK